ncbi:DUF1800 domain-containing protein [Rhodanobacter glycinis]|uniref:DUF1800 domain-containing protein n=1 Tax=Rhodanobacter glycinis TaxID=582702 RepID=A0A502CE40_9GAMM|nr:DUF1800 domain-containing protein [Rhodanobacter glycinis]TPG10056.1 DUF1800 domain-containing protein [Rhodanobacter glycinis]
MPSDAIRRSGITRVLRWLSAALVSLAPLAVSAQSNRPLSHDDVAWLQRVGFGIDSASVARYQQLGRARYLDEELAARDSTLPPAIDALINSYDVVRTPPAQLLMAYRDHRQQFKNAAEGTDKEATRKTLQEYRKKLYQQDAQVELLHAIYGRDQLKEQMVWFWLNHFSVYAAKGRVRLVATDYAEHAIRPHALGKFRELLMATLKSPAMLEFLDNAQNIKGKTNENYARELMELHTLGVGAGYTQQDVQQLALILTGAGIAPLHEGRPGRFGERGRAGFVRDGLFVFNPNRHDFSDKTLLGHTIKGSGYDEIEQAVTLITRQPACARFVSRQLAEYFVADQPPPALVAAMTQTFQRTDGDIAAVLRTMFDSPALAASHGKKFKDPIQFLVSAIRLTYDGKPIGNAAPLVNWLNQMGEPVFGRITPDGWPLDGASWSGSGQMVKRFDVARAIGSGRNRLFMSDDDATGPRPGAPTLNTPLYRAAIEPHLSDATRTALGKAQSPAEWNTFLLSSPDFNYR